MDEVREGGLLLLLMTGCLKGFREKITIRLTTKHE